jgi:excinuclease ABC subunit B
MTDFRIVSDFRPMGDQPRAIEQLTGWLQEGQRHQTLLGATGTGKTFVMAQIVERLQRPALVLAPNKTLAAQLWAEFKDIFPDNAVEYFVSYYDYYQPEAYIPRSDTYIAKDADINEEIDKLRHAATRALFERRDVLIVASVSCIYGLGEPEEYQSFVLTLKKGEPVSRSRVLRRLVDMQYERNDMNLVRGKFRLRGDSLMIHPAYEELAIRIDFWGDEVERVLELDPLTGEILAERDSIDIYPAKHFVTSRDKLEAAMERIEEELEERLREFKADGKVLEAARLEERTRYDLETMREMGYCPGVENYSRHLQLRPAGSRPWTLLDYLPPDHLMFIDESHLSVPQVRGMYHGDMARKQTLVDFGFRLPSAKDNRPLTFEEFEDSLNQVVYVSATPGPYEYEQSERLIVREPVRLDDGKTVLRARVVQPGRVAEQVIRPTGILDPVIEVKKLRNPVDDLLDQVRQRVERGERALVTTLTKRMAEELADYLQEMGIKTHYLHADVNTLERVDILRDLRLGVYDVVVGINLLREGLDLPEVSLVAILDADKEGYLRSEGALIQTAGRAARHPEGTVIMYADTVTDSMARAIDETNRRRAVQRAYNEERGITPTRIPKAIRDINDRVRRVAEERAPYGDDGGIPKDELVRMIKDLEGQMKTAARNLEYEKAALIRDQIVELRRTLIDIGGEGELTEIAKMVAPPRRERPLVSGSTNRNNRARRSRYK